MSLVASPDIMYRLLIQSVVDYAIYLLTPEGIVANWNPGAQRAKGYHADEIVGQHYSVFYSDAERAAGLTLTVTVPGPLAKLNMSTSLGRSITPPALARPMSPGRVPWPWPRTGRRRRAPPRRQRTRGGPQPPNRC